jgi:hypothetical protein
MAKRHVVWDDIEKDAHLEFPEFAHKGVEGCTGAYFSIYLHRICHGVPMQAAMAGLKKRRSIQVRYAKIVQIRHYRFGSLELEIAVKLDPVGG